MSPRSLSSLLVMTILSACASGVGHYIPEVRVDSDAVQPFANTGTIRFENQSSSGLRDLDFRDKFANGAFGEFASDRSVRFSSALPESPEESTSRQRVVAVTC